MIKAIQYKVVSVTGHRPNKLYGYDLTTEKWIKLKHRFKAILRTVDCKEAISGMALGVDTVFALAVLELKQEGYPIKLHCAIPCLEHSCKWTRDSRILYDEILKRADTVRIVTEQPYSPYLMQLRNEYMVDRSDLVLAVWDGTTGGTGNCVDYARKQNKPGIGIAPITLDLYKL